MKQALHKPQDPKVRQIIACMGYVELTGEDSPEGWFGLFPNGSSNLTISLNEDPVVYSNEKGQSLLYTSWAKPAAIKRKSNLRFINLQFKPFGIYALRGIPMTELINTTLTLDLFFPRQECSDLLDRLNGSLLLYEKFMELEKFVADHVDIPLIDERLRHALPLFRRFDSNNIDYLSKEVCLSTRRFRELFSKQTGYSPGLYKKIIRFNRAAQHVANHPEDSLTSVAHAFNYYDQSHFIKDFRLFSGITPSQFVRQKAKTADFYNFDL